MLMWIIYTDVQHEILTQLAAVRQQLQQQMPLIQQLVGGANVCTEVTLPDDVLLLLSDAESFLELDQKLRQQPITRKILVRMLFLFIYVLFGSGT